VRNKTAEDTVTEKYEIHTYSFQFDQKNNVLDHINWGVFLSNAEDTVGKLGTCVKNDIQMVLIFELKNI